MYRAASYPIRNGILALLLAHRRLARSSQPRTATWRSAQARGRAAPRIGPRTGPANTCSWFCKAGDESGLRVFLLESRRSLDVGSVRRTKVLQTRRPLVAAPSNKAGGEHGAASELRDSEPQLTTTPASHTSYDLLLLPSTSSSSRCMMAAPAAAMRHAGHACYCIGAMSCLDWVPT